MIRFALVVLAVAAGATQAVAQQQQQQQQQQAPTPSTQSQEERWLVTDTRVASVPARLAFPRQIGALTASRTQELSHQGEGIDNALQYRSADNAVFATLYVYYPGLPHAGIAAFATDHFIRANEPATRIATPMRLVAAGGIDNAAIRIDYANYRGMASSAAFIKAGRWIVKVRVSGPANRRTEVEAAMGALLQRIEFGRASPWMAPHPLTIGDCPANSGRTAARLLPDPAGAEIAAHAFLATFDGGGNPATDETNGARRDLPPRVPDRLCLDRLRVGNATIPLLRGEAGAAISVDGRTRLVAVLNDAGAMLEVVHAANLGRYLVLHHEVGMTRLLGGYDNVPSDAQIAEILGGGTSEASRIRVPVRLRPNRGPEMFLPGAANPERPATPQT